MAEGEIFENLTLRIKFRALAKMILCKIEAPMARLLESSKANFLKIMPLRINFRALPKMNLCKTEAPMARV